MIDYTHPSRPARHAACHTWDDAGHACRVTGPSHDCDAATVILPTLSGRDVRVSTATSVVIVPIQPGRGAHRLAGVSLVKSYV